MTTPEKAFNETLSLFCKCENTAFGNPAELLRLLMNEVEDPEFINELCKFSESCAETGKPIVLEFVHGVIFYQQYLKFKQIMELEEWNKEFNKESNG